MSFISALITFMSRWVGFDYEMPRQRLLSREIVDRCGDNCN